MGTYTGSDKRLQFLFDMVSNFAPIYSNTATYAVGAYSIYQGILYKCVNAVTSGENFDPSKWSQVLVMSEISSGGGGSIVSITPTLQSGTKIADFSINGVPDELYAPSGGGSGCNYSFLEQVVGTWTNGKPLYQITVDFGAVPNNSTKTVAHGVANIEEICNVWGILHYSGIVFGETLPTGDTYKMRTAVRSTTVEMTTNASWSSYTALITFQYTKTTD